MPVLLVGGKPALRTAIFERLTRHAAVDMHADFLEARARLVGSQPYTLLITSLRLGPYNGLHLVYLAQALQLPLRAIVYDEQWDPYNAAEVQSAGAFFEPEHRIVAAAPGYVGVTLPPIDRRNPTVFDRRLVWRGGRRAADVAGPVAAA